MANIVKATFKWIFILLATLLGLLIVGLLLLQLRVVKESLTFQTLKIVSQITDHRVELGQVSINWLDLVKLEGLELYDKEDSLMLSADNLIVNYSLFDLISSGEIHVEGLHIDGGSLNLLKHNDSSGVNINVFLASLSKGAQVEKDKPSIAVAEINMQEFDVGYRDLRRMPPDSGQQPFSPSWFDFKMEKLDAERLLLKNDSLTLDIHEIVGEERYSSLPVVSFSSAFGLFPKAIIMDELRIRTNNSFIKDSLVLEFSRPAMLGYMRDSVTITANLAGSTIALEDIRYFSNVDVGKEVLEVSGLIHGRISNLDLKRFAIETKRGSYFNASASLIGLPYVSETFMDIRVTSSEVKTVDLNRYLPPQTIYPGDIRFSGDLLGFVNDFVATGNFRTDCGMAYSDLNLKIAEYKPNTRYKGSLVLSDFDVGALIGNGQVGRVNFRGSVDGKGFTPATADVKINARAWNSEIASHNYDSLGVIGQFKSNFFDGFLDVSDEWIKLSGEATIDFASSTEVISLNLDVDTLDLYSYKVTDSPAIFSSKVTADLNELNPDEMFGVVNLSNVVLVSEEQNLSLNRLQLKADSDEKGHSYALISDIARIDVSGHFKLTEIARSLPKVLTSYKDYFILSQDQFAYEGDTLQYQIDLNVMLYDINPLSELLGLEWRISDSTRVEATLTQRSDASFFLYTEIDTIHYKDRTFFGNSLEINASKDADSTAVLALVQLTSGIQQWNEKIQTQNLNLESIWSNNLIHSNLGIEQQQNQNRANLKTQIHLMKDTIDFKVLPSRLQIFNTDWKVSKENNIRVLKDKLLIEDIEMYNGAQSVSMQGVLSDSFLTQVTFDFINFDLLNISTLLPRSIAGVVNASGRISRLSKSRPMRFESDVAVKNLEFEGVLVGNLDGYSEWDKEANGLYLDYSIERSNINTIDLNGYYKPFDESPLELDVNFDQANLNLLEPIFDYMVSDLSGTATGQLSLTGAPSRPIVRGLAMISDGRVTIDYLNTVYRFGGITRFFENQIAFDNIKVQDRLNHNAVLNGVISHKQFTNFALNIDMNYQDFELLNTNQQQNSLYYGNAYATGTMKMIGPAENLLIRAEATSSKDTRIFIPLIEESGVKQESFITFSQKGEVKEAVKDELNLTGLSIDFDMNLTPDAYIELIFNPRTGDIIRGRGNGNLQLTVNSSGDFDLFGSYTVSEGAYNFTTGLINKEFQVQPGGTISWFGDPYEGQMDISATYRQLADIRDWGATDTTAQKRPVLVVLDLDGSMMAPDIQYKLQLADETNVSASDVWMGSLATINANDEELKRQVFSLLILRKFSEREGFVVGSSSVQSFTSSMGELIGNQLSYWVNQMDENLEVDFDINDLSLSQDALNTFQLRLTYSFLDGRLRVTRGGGVTTVVEEGSTTDLGNILGDWSVEYVLTKDGKWRARFFSRNNQYGTSAGQTLNLSQGQENGLSLQFVTSFDEFRELLNMGKKEEEPQLVESDDPSEEP